MYFNDINIDYTRLLFKIFIFSWKKEKKIKIIFWYQKFHAMLTFFFPQRRVKSPGRPCRQSTPPSHGTAWVFTPTIPTIASTAVDLEIAEEQPLLWSKRRRILRSVVDGFGVLVSPLRSVYNRRVHLCSCEFIR